MKYNTDPILVLSGMIFAWRAESEKSSVFGLKNPAYGLKKLFWRIGNFRAKENQNWISKCFNFVAQKLPAVRNMFFQPVQRVFQVRKDDFLRFWPPLQKLCRKKPKLKQYTKNNFYETADGDHGRIEILRYRILTGWQAKNYGKTWIWSEWQRVKGISETKWALKFVIIFRVWTVM